MLTVNDLRENRRSRLQVVVLTAMAQPFVLAVPLGQERLEYAGREICWYFRTENN